MFNSTVSRSSRKAIEKLAKPYADFPLFSHATKRWAKKILGNLHDFGHCDDPDAALRKYLDERVDLQAGELTNRTFLDYTPATDRIIVAFGMNRLVDDLAAEIRSTLGKADVQLKAMMLPAILVNKRPSRKPCRRKKKKVFFLTETEDVP